MRVHIEHSVTMLMYCDELTAARIDEIAEQGGEIVEADGGLAFKLHEYLLEAENGVRKRETSWTEMEKGWYDLPDEAFPIPDSTDGDPAYMDSKEYSEYLLSQGVW